MKTDHDFDVGVIISTREEFESAREILDFDDPIEVEGAYLHPFHTKCGTVNGIAQVLFGLGQSVSAIAATQLLSRSPVRVLASIGIASALSSEFRNGDVILASAVDEYMVGGKISQDVDGITHFEVGGISWRAEPAMVDYVENFRYFPATTHSVASWRQRSAERQDPVSASMQIRDYPDYHVAPIATGDIACETQAFALWLRLHNRFRAAVEMEAGGVAEAVYRHHKHRPELIVIRGIANSSSINADAHRMDAASIKSNKIVRRWAGLNATDLFVTLIANPQFPWPSPIPGMGNVTYDGLAENRTTTHRIDMHANASGRSVVNQVGQGSQWNVNK